MPRRFDEDEFLPTDSDGIPIERERKTLKAKPNVQFNFEENEDPRGTNIPIRERGGGN